VVDVGLLVCRVILNMRSYMFHVLGKRNSECCWFLRTSICL